MPTFEETSVAIQLWWSNVRKQAASFYSPGQLLSLPTGGIAFTAFHDSIERLYVRAIFPSLFDKVVRVLAGSRKWQLCHLCGNSGVGKSAFLWYFIIRVGVDNEDSVILYESGSFVWEFRGPTVVVVPKVEFDIRKITEDVTYHLVDQKAAHPLGARVLVAASPDISNVKDAKKLRTTITFFMPAWDRTEYFALVDSWKNRVGNPPDQELSLRLGAAQLAFEWFGGIPRFLWDTDVDTLTEKHFKTEIVRSLSSTKLKNVSAVLQAGANSQSWRLFHFRLEDDSFKKFHYTFCSDKVADLYCQYLSTQNHDKIKSFLEASQPFPEYSALRGFVFEQYVIGQALHEPLMALPLIDHIYCARCKRKEGEGRKRMLDWIECDQCRVWFHVTCARILNNRFTCNGCKGAAETESVSDGNLMLRYYEGELEDALLAAGEDATKYVWRPLKKNNAVFDFVVLPYTLAQVTVSTSHPVHLGALVNGLKALRAWREEFGIPQRDDMLLFLVPPDIFPDFRFQPYRGASRRVSQSSVQGVVQCKVAVPVNGSPYVGFDLGYDSAAPVPAVPLDLDASLETLEQRLNCVESEEALLVEETAERSLEEEKKAMMKRPRVVSDANDLEGRDFVIMSRKQLQALCKQHKIPANTTNVEMQRQLAELASTVEL